MIILHPVFRNSSKHALGDMKKVLPLKIPILVNKKKLTEFVPLLIGRKLKPYEKVIIGPKVTKFYFKENHPIK